MLLFSVRYLFVDIILSSSKYGYLLFSITNDLSAFNALLELSFAL